MNDVAENLRIQARRSQRLVIWTDCDREGEYIGAEIEKICLEANPSIDTFRARYSVVSPRDIHRAMNQLDRLDRKQVSAVSTRQELDLRSGASLTRLQSLNLRARFPQLKNVVSYGSCQFPTLGFVVEQYLKLLNFIPHQFWTINLSINHQGIQVRFKWDRNRLFDHHAATVLFYNCSRFQKVIITSARSNPTSKWKPLPLRTVEFQKKASKALRLSSDKLMTIAESLYNQGYISYPRTETDQFDSKFDHRQLIEIQSNHPMWGSYAGELLNNNRYGPPRLGKNNDKAHPPIHPTKSGAGLIGDEGKVYEFIVRSYLAAMSQDAKGEKTVVKARIGQEGFHASGIVVTERNYLDVYPYEFWNEKPMANFNEGGEYLPAEFLLESGTTTCPLLLSESDLIGTMDKNGIGTDATIHEHIKKIIERNYVKKQRDSRFVPTILGLSIVQGYDQIGLEYSLTKPKIRAKMEADLNKICDGQLQPVQVVRQAIEMYRNAFGQAKTHINILFDVLSRNLNGNDDPFSPAPLPQMNSLNPNRNQRRPINFSSRDNRRDDGSDSDDNNQGPSHESPQPSNGPLCSCGNPSSLKKTIKAGPNQGRMFWSCSTCNFFEWNDEDLQKRVKRTTVSTIADENSPICSCGRHAIVRTVSKEGPNHGREFYCCSASSENKCSFFLWKDGHENDKSNESSIMRCQCGLIAILDTAKSGPNTGRSFYRCSKQVKRCTYFQWEGSSSQSTSNSTDPRCFKCGQVPAIR